MLKHYNIITKLSDEQKIRILSNVGNISETNMRLFGIPNIKAGYMKDYCGDVYPQASSLAHTWNVDLWRNVAMDRIACMRKDNVNFVIAPGAKIKLSPYQNAMTEDPFLASVISGTYMKAASDSGVVSGASDYYVANSDANWMDSEPNSRILNEYIVSPYINAAEGSGIGVVVTDAREPNGKYKNSCSYIQNQISDKMDFFVCDSVDDAHTVDYIAKGIVCLKASANVLSAAFTRYKKLKKLLEQGKDVTAIQIEEELQERSAISEESVNRALDKALDFIFRCSMTQKNDCETSEANSELALKAVLESTVLLKNKDRILPLDKKCRVGIIGDIAFSNRFGEGLALTFKRHLELAGYKCTDISKGYDLSDYHQYKYYPETMNICQESDVILLFCGMEREEEARIPKTEKLTLPPNQLHLANKLTELGKKVVVILLTDHAPDIEFTRPFESVIVAPTEVKYSALALVKILSGEYAPTGKLAYTLYAGTEHAFSKAHAYMKSGIKTGPFIGYRYYDTADMRVGYPFGHGLTYTEFKYSGLKVTGSKISFTVKNVGDVAGTETAQIYVGKNTSSLLRPQKELCGFAKIELAPHQKKRVSLEINLPKVYDQEEFVTEKGLYTIYVGSSVSDIRLKCNYFSKGKELAPDGEQLSNYLQTYSNILEGKYTLEANYIFMKKSIQNMLIGIGATALAISIAVFNATTNASSLFLGIISGILALVAVAFFILHAIEKNKESLKERESIDEANKAHFEDAEKIPVISTELMFRENFDMVNDDAKEDQKSFDFAVDLDYSEHINENICLKDAVEDLKCFFAERGLKLNRGVAESLMSSLVSSRLMIFTGITSEEFNTVTSLLSAYFGSKAYSEEADADGGNGKNIFFDDADGGHQKKKNVFQALQSAGALHERIHIIAVDGITESNATDWLTPFVKYIKHPKKRNEISFFDESGKNVGYNIGRNLRMVLKLADGQRIDELPVDVAKLMTVVNIGFVGCQSSEEQASHLVFSSYQADYILSKECGKKDVSEEMWKKVDKLEKYTKQYSGYSIGNKLWLEFEKLVDILLACGFETVEALDVAISLRLLPSVTAALKDKLTTEDRTVLQTMEFIFGENNVAFSKAFLTDLNKASKKSDSEESDNFEKITE